MHKLYGLVRLYVNFFQPICKLVDKERVGAKVKKRYDKAQTPYQRLVEAGVLGEAERQALEQLYRSLNPVELRAGIDRELEVLWQMAHRGRCLAPVSEERRIRPVGKGIPFHVTHLSIGTTTTTPGSTYSEATTGISVTLSIEAIRTYVRLAMESLVPASLTY